MRLRSGIISYFRPAVRFTRRYSRSKSSQSSQHEPAAAWVDSTQELFESNASFEPIQLERPRIDPYIPRAPYMISDLILELDAADSEFVQTLEAVEKDGWRPAKPKADTAQSREPKDGPGVRLEKARADLAYFLRIHGVTSNRRYDRPNEAFFQPDSLGPQGETYEFLRDHLLEKYGSSSFEEQRVDRLDQFVIGYLLRTRTRWSSKFKPYMATPSDLLQYALKGDPWISKSDDNMDMQSVCEHEGVLKEDTESSTVKIITSKFGSDWSRQRRLEEAGFSARPSFADYGFIYESLRAPTSLKHLKRMVFLLTLQPKGCEWLSTYRDAAALRTGLNVLDISSGEKLKLLNNLRLNFESQGVYMSQILCNDALYQALKIENLGAIQVYLRLLSQQNFVILEWTIDAFSDFIWTVSKKTRADTPVFRNAIIQLCTGWEANGVPLPNEVRKPCFASMVQDDSFRPRYLHLLADLGAVEALEYEWEDTLRGHSIHLCAAISFAQAFLLLQRPDIALDILGVVSYGTQPAKETSQSGAANGVPSSLHPVRVEVFRAAYRVRQSTSSLLETRLSAAEKALGSTQTAAEVLEILQNTMPSRADNTSSIVI